MRRAIAQWAFRGRVRLGDGQSLDPILPEDLESLRRRFPRSKFFIFGHARSGTSFLARLIRLHPEIHCNWQTQFFSARGPIPYFTSPSFRHWLQHPSNRWVQDWDPTAVLLRVACDTILEREGEAVGKRIVGDKSPNGNGAQAVRWLSAVYPDARLIYILRDGRDVILSRRIQSFLDQPQNLGLVDRAVRRAFIHDPSPFLERRRSVFTPAWLGKAAAQWAKDVDESIRAGRERFGGSFAVVRYEDLLADPGSSLRRLWTFLGAQADPAALDSDLKRELERNPEAEWHGTFAFDFVQKLPRGVHGGWQSLFTPTDVDLFERAAGQVLEAWDYRRPS